MQARSTQIKEAQSTHVKVRLLQPALEGVHEPGEPRCCVRCWQLELVVVASVKVAALVLLVQAAVGFVLQRVGAPRQPRCGRQAARALDLIKDERLAKDLHAVLNSYCDVNCNVLGRRCRQELPEVRLSLRIALW